MHLPAIAAPYLYDDVALLEEDERLTEPALWPQYLTESYNGGVDNLLRPLVSISFALQWQLHGHRPWLFRSVNLLCHAGVSVMVFALLRRTLERLNASQRLRERGPVVAGLLFAVLSVHSEVAISIVGRSELFCTLAALTAMWLCLDAKRMTWPRSIGIVACFFAALLSKEQGLLLLPLLAINVWLIRRMPIQLGERTRWQTAALLMMFGLAGYIVWRESHLKFWWNPQMLDWTIQPIIRANALDRFLIPIAAVGRYLQITLAPINLSIDYGPPLISYTQPRSDPFLYLGFVGLAAMLGGLVWSVARFRRLVAARITFALLLPMVLFAGLISNLPTIIGTVFGERLIYLPSVFAVMLAACAIAMLPRRAVLILVTLGVMTYGLRTASYARQWNDRLGYYLAALHNQPDSLRFRVIASQEAALRGQLDLADALATEARERGADWDESWYASANVAIRRSDFVLAQQYIERGHQARPSIKSVGWQKRLDDARRNENRGIPYR